MILYSLYFNLLFSFLFFIQSHAKLTLKAISYPPFADCSEYTPNDSTTVGGAEIQLIRSAFAYLNWTEGTDYEFSCVSKASTLFDDFANLPAGSEEGIVGGISITSDRLKQNYQFSQPTTTSPLYIVYRQLSKGWFFRRSLDIPGWIIVFASIFGMGVFIYLLENKKAAYINMLYHSICQFFLVPDYPLENYSSKILNFFSTFLAFIVIMVFTASSTNIFQSDRNISSILTLDNLGNQKVYTNDVLKSYLEKYGISPLTINDTNPFLFSSQTDKLGINYLVLDGPYSDFLVRQNCDLYTGTNVIDNLYYGIMLPSDFSHSLKLQINEAILTNSETKLFSHYVSEYYASQEHLSICIKKHALDSDQITLYDMRGLWFILAAGLGFGVGVAVFHKLGFLIKRSFGIFGMKGVRAKIDRKIQRRVATVFAIHTAISMQSINFFKKLNQEALSKWISSFRLAVQSKIIDSTYSKLFIENKEEPQSSKKFKRRLRKSKGSNLSNDGGNSPVRVSSIFDWFRRKSGSKELPESKQFISTNLSNINRKRLSDRNSLLGEGLKRKNTMVRQSLQNYHLGKDLVAELGVLGNNLQAEASNDPKKTGGDPRKISVYLKNLGLEDGVQDFMKKKQRSRGFWIINKILGKRGVKVNKQISNSANYLLKMKETQLMDELTKKKLQIAEQNSLLEPNSATSLRQQQTPIILPLVKNSIYQPFNHSNTNDLPPEYLDFSASYRRDRKIEDQETTARRLKNFESLNNRTFSIESAQLRQNMVETPQRNIVLNIPNFKEEDFEFNMNETPGESRKSVQDASVYNFVKSSRRTSK